MPKVMKTQVGYVKKFARLAKGAAYRSWFERKYPVVIRYLATNYLPRFWRVLEAADSVTLGGMLEISDSTGLRVFIIIAEEEVGDLSLPACRVNGKPHDVVHWYVRTSLVATFK